MDDNIQKNKNQYVKNKKNKNSKKSKKEIVDIYKEKKLSKIKVQKFLLGKLTFKGVKRYKRCGGYLLMIATEDLSKRKVVKHESCKNRFCPICEYKKSRKEAFIIAVMMKYINIELKKRFLFLTLTAPNVKSDDLKEEINDFNYAFKKFMLTKELVKINKGYVRKLELTYNQEKDTYHAHFHVILCVNKSYFGDNKIYLTQQDFLKIWQKCKNDDTITQVDVRAIGEGSIAQDKASFEVAKYTAKSTEYTNSQSVFDVFYDCLKGRQLLTYNKVFKEALKKYKNKELTKYDTLDNNEYVYRILYRWKKDDYAFFNQQPLTDLEKALYNKNLPKKED